MSNILPAEHKIILDLVDDNSSVLDLGCGDGELLDLLVKEKNVNGQGIEIDEQRIYECVAKGLSVCQGDIDTGLSEYADNSFDFILLNQTFQQIKKPAFVVQEALRVGKQSIISFPNFLYFKARLRMFLNGRVPITPSLPYEWYNTPNLHFLSFWDFKDYCKKANILVKKEFFTSGNLKIKFFPNLFAQIGIFLIGK